MVFLSQKEIDAKANQRLQRAKALYSEFSRLLDCNYAAGDAISGVQYGRGNKPITGHVTSVIENTRGMLDSYGRIIEQSGPMVSGERLELKELDGRMEAIGEAALGYARVHDSLLKSEPEEIKYCIPKIKQTVESTSGEMCHPEKRDAFCAKNVRSLQDAMRYLHEKAIDAVFGEMHDPHGNEKHAGARFANFGNVVVFDIGGAISGSANPDEPVGLEDIVSEPLKAVGEYCKGLKCVKVFAARDFMSAQIHIGVYHKAGVDAMIRKADFVEGENNSANNHIRLRYIESGCAGSDCRLGYMSKVLKGLGFRIETEGRFMNAELKGRYPDSTETALKKLFRLLRSCENGLEILMDALVEKKMSEDAKMTRETAAKMVMDMAARELEKGNERIYDFLLDESIKKKRTPL